MRKPNFNKLSSEVLSGYKSEIEQILKGRKQDDEKKNKLLKKMKSLAESEGLDLESLLSTSIPGKTRKAVAKEDHSQSQPEIRQPERQVTDLDRSWP